ncbi:aminoglycoside phosphotransferase family protein [Sulfitobacter sp. JB4-11]|uniref:aminoglycoside phosphotransferase family protein n=1 Tax=Sulfitobacter rhodophyticola TaxID=3238304 RepID=UPI00351389DF
MAQLTTRAALRDAFIERVDWADARQSPVTGDASNRRYDRLSRENGETAILMDAPPERGEDVRPFAEMAAYLRSNGLSAPQIYAQDLTQGFLLLEDLGTDRFAEAMADDPARILPLYHAAADVLIALHRAPLPDLPLCDEAWLTGALAPFLEWYPTGMNKAQLDTFLHAFAPLVREVAAADPVVILRDYHAENLIWLPRLHGVARVGLLDFQDARLGHPAYDLVSILQDARRDVSPEVENLVKSRFRVDSGYSAGAFDRAYAILGVQRNLRILGLFVRLCQRDGKPGYVRLIPRVWGYVTRGLAHPALAPVADVLRPHLTEPTPSFLSKLKSDGR